VDSQGRRHGGSGSPGRSGDVDPADQWVFDPDTGSYELRLTPPSPGGTAPRATATVPSQADSPENEPERRAPGGRAAARRGAAQQGQDGPAGRAAARRARTKAAATGRRKAKSAKKRALHWTAGTLGFLLVAGCTGGYLVYEHFNNNINSYKADLGSNRPEAGAAGAMNILLIGTDSRKGLGRKYGDAGSVGHADTTFLFHVSKDRTNATALSIPRDLMVPIPECTTEGGGRVISGQASAMFNTSLGQDERGPDCTWKTVEKLTGIRIDHFMMVNFEAVKTLSTAVGGVDVCLAHPVHDPDSHLNLSAGHHNVKGEQALAFVRTRHAVGFGGDLTRIPLQQQFLSSMIRKVKSNGTLTSPTKLWKLADAATKSLTVDSGIGSVKKLMGLGQDLGKVSPKNITFATVPVADDPVDKNRLVLKDQDAKQLFAMVKADHSLTKVERKGKGGKKPAPTETTKAAPANVRVKVVNGSGKVGAAQETVEWLQNAKGVIRSSNGLNAPSTISRTTLEYAPNQADQARALQAMMGLPESALKETGKDAAPLDQMTLTLGKDYQGAGVPLTAPTAAPSDLQSVNAGDKSVCAK
jgi:LCP family protein required for cell wall assembly